MRPIYERSVGTVPVPATPRGKVQSPCTPLPHPAPHPPRGSRTAAALLLLALALGGAALLATAPRAHAADLGDVFAVWSHENDGADPVSLELLEDDEDGQIQQFEYVRLHANWWLTGLDTATGDTCSLTLPEQFDVDVADFALRTPEEIAIGTCRVEPAGVDGAGRVTCTLTDQEYLDAHEGVHGWIELGMQADERYDGMSVDFGVPGGLLTVPLPRAGGIVGPHVGERPTELAKVGWFDAARTEAQWRIHVPGSALAEDVDGLTVVDELPEGLAFDRGRVVAVEDSAEGREAYVIGEAETLAEDAHSVAVDGQQVRVEIPEVDPGMLYIIEIDTRIDEPAAIADGTQFTNVAQVNGEQVGHTATVWQRGSGGADGHAPSPEPEEPTTPEEPVAEETTPGEPTTVEPEKPATDDSSDDIEEPATGDSDEPADPGESTDTADFTEPVESDAAEEDRPELAETGAQGVGVVLLLGAALLVAGGAILGLTRIVGRR